MRFNSLVDGSLVILFLAILGCDFKNLCPFFADVTEFKVEQQFVIN